MTEHLTAEITQLTVSDVTRAIEWMKCSYLYVRIKKACNFNIRVIWSSIFLVVAYVKLLMQNPEKYEVRKSISRDRIEKHMQGGLFIKLEQSLIESISSTFFLHSSLI